MRRFYLHCTLWLLLMSVYKLWGQEQPLRLNYLNPETYTIDSLSVKGAESLSPSALLLVSGLRIGDEIQIPGPRIAEAIKNIWRQDLLSHIDLRASLLSPGSIRLIFVIKERSRLTGFGFSGVSRTQRQELDEKLQLSAGRTLTDLLCKQIENTVHSYFEEKGYLHAQVRLRTRPDTLITNGVRLRISVKKGHKVKVRSMRFLGQQVFSQPQLKQQFTGLGDALRFGLHKQLLSEALHLLVHPRRSIGFLSTSSLPKNLKRYAHDYLHRHAYLNFFKGRKFEEKAYQEGKEQLISFLLNKGYRNAYIRLDTLRKQHTNDIDIAILLYVGRKHYIRDIRWTGNFIYDSATLSRTLGIEKGEVYDFSLLERRLHFNPQGLDVSSLYLDDGYLFFNVEPIEVRVERDSVDIEMRIYEGKQADIDRVLVKGNIRTREHVIRRELRTLPGDRFSRADIIRTQQLLNQLPFIDAQATKPVPIPKPDTQKVDIEWQITEKAGDQVELSAGWGGGVGFVGTVGFVLNNFSLRDLWHLKRWRPLPIGDGQSLSIRLRSNGRAFSSMSTSFTEPWLGGRRRNNFTVGYNYSRERYFFGNRVTGSFSLYGMNMSLVRSLRWPDDYFSLGYYGAYKGYLLKNAANRSLGFDNGHANAVSFSLALARSSIDNPSYPRGGSYFSLSLELTPPYSWFRSDALIDAENNVKYRWIEYNKWLFDAKSYVEILPKLVLENRLHMGVIGRYGSKGVHTPFERFVLGGDGQGGQDFILGTEIIGLRGYPNNSISPRDPINNIAGGRYFTKAVFELRYLVLQLPAGTIYTLAFLEGGNSWNHFENFSFYNIHRSLGMGIRLQVPAIGIIGLDWGRPFDKLFNQPLSSQLHFTIGTSIR